MKNNLVIGLLGKPGAGKSYIWSKLFGRDVKTGKKLRKLYFNEKEYVEVFLVNVPAVKRHKYIGEIITIEKPAIILCSMDYSVGVTNTVDYFNEQKYSMLVYWLNPGYKEKYDPLLFFTLGIINRLIEIGALVGRRSGKDNPDLIVDEIRDYLYGWAKSKKLIQSKK